MQVSILNVKYSPNLGDGIIAECFEYALNQCPEVAGVSSCDLAGRDSFGEGVNATRQTIRKILDAIPGPLRQVAVSTLLETMIALKLSNHYQRSLDGSDVILVGGGQLIADKELNFPRKILAALKCAAAQDVKIGLHGVGVAADFTKKGVKLFNKAFDGKLQVANARDRRSVERWNRTFGAPVATQAWDPGLLSSQVYPKQPAVDRGNLYIGVGVTNPNTLQLHADKSASVLDRKAWIAFYKDLILNLKAGSAEVKLFTNGAHDDYLFAQSIADAVKDASASELEIPVAAPGKIPADLAGEISTYDAIVAHRLHANIIAYSYQIPHVGLGWDSKMQGFFEETSRSQYLVQSPTGDDVDRVAELLLQAVKDPIDPGVVARIQTETHAQIEQLVRSLK